MATTSAQVQQLYVAYLGRAADKAGLDYWLNELNGDTTAPATLTLEDLRANFVNEQPEYQNAYAGLTRTETVSKIYLQLFGHSADAAGLAYWTTGGGASVETDQLLVAFVNGASATDAKIVANKVLVAEVYTSTAGDNYTSDDATSVLAGVDGTTASVTTALTNLAALPGIAIPASVAEVKADVAAAAAVTAYEASKVDSLSALNAKVVALNAGYTASLTAIADTNNNGSIDYNEAAVAIPNATALRANISTSSTADLQTASTNANTTVAADRADLVANDVNAVAKINTYNAAVAADAKVAVVAPTSISSVEGGLDGVIGSGTANQTAFTSAVSSYHTASGTTVTIANATELYAVVKASAGDANALTQLDAAFNTGVFAATYSALKTVAVADAAKAASTQAVTDATTALSSVHATTYAADSVAATNAAKILADAQSADALVTQANAEVTAHTAVLESAADAHAAVVASANIHDLDATSPVLAGTAAADLFYFSAIKATDDFTITAFNKGDALYIGDGYTFNSNVKVGTDGFYTGTNTSAKEVFFLQDATTKVVSAVIETNAVGHTAGTGTTDNVAVITLSGITDLSQVSYANGVITTTHVA
ncbi:MULTISPECIES: DUF4214 domain-containing protein [unclassified Pseudomonas]|uniref:DUF4214 domain-containing protein n=1 Tax=unclassified Pseudomonas TaxID=196821 RepID=UPI0025F55AC0|nr:MULTISPECIES: DUF4214 domain-containing protein [unclassified Pseudomonas]